MSMVKAECSCDFCVSCCEHIPGWPTVAEAEALMDAGHGDRLMLDYWCRAVEGDIPLLCPAVVGCEGKHAPFYKHGRCTFFTAERRCEIHSTKPIECAVAVCPDKAKYTNDEYHAFRENLAMEWDSEKGRALVARWKNEHKLSHADRSGISDLFDFLDDLEKLNE